MLSPSFREVLLDSGRPSTGGDRRTTNARRLVTERCAERYFAADVQTVCHRSNTKAIAYCQIVAAIKRFHTGYPGQT